MSRRAQGVLPPQAAITAAYLHGLAARIAAADSEDTRDPGELAGSAPIVSNLVRAVVVYAVAFAMVYIIAGVIDLLAPRFGAERNFPSAVKLSAYSHTPLWLAGIFLLIPGLNFLLILGLYGFYLLRVGLPMLMKVPNDKALPYAAIVTACALVPAIVLTMI